ncbi:MAG: type II toxin-antitoxin system prevent-host-death family antitoxin [Propionibacteriaceae bacterium]|nr:type II toxin-antitoxin system prevent-host-death family antitoxin [Propionibacteriaceae bacterium]
MSMSQTINQRDLRMRSREIMDAVERGEEFVVTRDGRDVGELIPLRRTQRFVHRADFVAMSAGLVPLDPDRFFADLAGIDQDLSDPYGR